MIKVIFAVLCAICISANMLTAAPKIDFEDKKVVLTIPDSLLGRELLFGSRIVSASQSSGKLFAAGMMRSVPSVVSFELLENGNGIAMSIASDNYTIDAYSESIADAVAANNTKRFLKVFKSSSSTCSGADAVIDATDYFTQVVAEAWPLPANYKLGRLIPELTNIERVSNHESHTNIRVAYHFAGDKPFSITVQYFLMELPEPLEARSISQRVGYQRVRSRNYSIQKGNESREQIVRWRIEPKAEEVAAYLAGEVVEPVQKIKFYIDPAFPKSWVPYMKEGIEVWNSAFERIGFKDVVSAEEFPSKEQDPEFDPYDVGINVVRYIPNDEANAAGIVWSDPRTGEVLMGDILWWNNIVKMLYRWRFLQTAAADPRARYAEMSEEMMGEAIRYTVAHEMGHILGMEHNMRGSFAYESDSLRSASFTQRYGTTASIMDYARFNHLATAEDVENGVSLLPPALGEFDYAALAYGYLYRPNSSSLEVEKEAFGATLDDAMLAFAPMQSAATPYDPSAQSETLGNSVVKSSLAGIRNMNILLENLLEWTFEYGGDVDLLRDRYSMIVAQYFRYINLLGSNIAGRYELHVDKSITEPRYDPISLEESIESAKMIIDLVAQSSNDLLDEELATYSNGVLDTYTKGVTTAVELLVSNFTLQRVVDCSALWGNERAFAEYLEAVDSHLWKNLSATNPSHQLMAKVYVETLLGVSNSKTANRLSLVQGELNRHLASVRRRVSRSKEWRDIVTVELQNNEKK